MRTSAEMIIGKWGKSFGLETMFLRSKRLRVEFGRLSEILNNEKSREKIGQELIVSRISRDLCARLLCLLTRKQTELIDLEQALFCKVEAGLEWQRRDFAMKKIKQRSFEELYKNES